ncbi:hypothetical protein ACFQ9V_18725 [Leifsonia sp. NPDC056665]|uniref:hypothetical protein n=1 Tax=Leifsonia sp. NPDC056665 TaxID=3345901 RepID=UPI0036C2454B
MKNINLTSTMATLVIVACCLLLTGCGPEPTSPQHHPTASQGATRHPGATSSAAPTEHPEAKSPDAGGTAPGSDPTAQIRTACALFAATFEQKVAEKFPNQRKAAELAQAAAREDAQWQTTAEYMTLILDVGERVNLPGGRVVTVEEGNSANQAVAEVRDRCVAAGAEFTLPAD